MKKVIIFDGQVFQTSAWDRGMGKYSLSLLDAMAAQLKGADGYIVFNKTLQLSDEAEAAIKSAIPDLTFASLDLQMPNPHDFETKEMLRCTRHNQHLLERFVDEVKKKNDTPEFVILSLFLDEVCSVFPETATKTLLFYDLIPLLFAERYSQNENYESYLARIPIALRADKIMAISQTVADDLVTHLGVAPEKVVNIQGAPVNRNGHATAQPKSVDEGARFILMTSGNDLRKNNINAVRGFEEYRAATGQYDLRLAITSHFDKFAVEELEQFSDGIIFTGNVSEQELKWLYDNALATLFVPEYEGLGLPILEAIESNKPIVCSTIGAFREMSETAFYYADHHAPISIAAAISQALAGDAWQQRQSEYDAILKRYSWAKTAKLAVAELMKPVGGTSQQKKRLAVLTPTPKGYSAIGKVVQQMHASLSEHFVIDYYFENGTTNHEFKRESYLEFTGDAYDAKEFNADAYARYDAVLYHIGNSEFHINAIKNALYLPGYAVIHDTKLTEIFGYMNQLGVIVPERFEAERKLDETIGSPETDQLVSLVNNQLGVVVHSKYAQKAIEAIVRSGDTMVHKLNLPTGTPRLGKRSATGLTVGMAGVIHEGKGLRLLEELATMPEFGAVTFSIFGVPVAPPEVLERLTKNPTIAMSTNLSDMDFQDALSGLDVLVNYREEYRGETSLSTLEAMRLGIVPIVRNIGWYGELPDSVAIKVDSGDAIVGVLRDIVAGKIDIEAMGNKAKKYAAQRHSYQGYSEQIRDVIGLPFSSVQRIERIKKGELFTGQKSQ